MKIRNIIDNIKDIQKSIETSINSIPIQVHFILMIVGGTIGFLVVWWVKKN